MADWVMIKRFRDRETELAFNREVVPRFRQIERVALRKLRQIDSAGRLSDLIVITSDNPRSEDPQRILEEIQRGITADTRRDSGQRLLSIVDRREAIQRAIEVARPGDVVLVAGKGHEKYQVIGDRVLPFDDVAVVRDALNRRRSNSGVV